MEKSEFDTPPLAVLLHHPANGGTIRQVNSQNLSTHNFLAVPDQAILHHEYDGLVAALSKHTETKFLCDVLEDDKQLAAEAVTNPNLMFCRDSAITLPWAPDVYLPARFALPSRQNESALMAKTLRKLGLRSLIEFEGDEYLEGGDVYPAMDAGHRILMIGFGVRTTKSAAIKIALKLIPSHFDQVIGLSHDPNLLHLDTGFTVLPNRVMFAATGMFHEGFMFDRQRQLHEVDPISAAEDLGFHIIRCSKEDAILHERCNMLALGNRHYLAFSMPEETKATLERAASITIETIKGTELAKATGGVRCLTRPVYG